MTQFKVFAAATALALLATSPSAFASLWDHDINGDGLAQAASEEKNQLSMKGKQNNKDVVIKLKADKEHTLQVSATDSDLELQADSVTTTVVDIKHNGAELIVLPGSTNKGLKNSFGDVIPYIVTISNKMVMNTSDKNDLTPEGKAMHGHIISPQQTKLELGIQMDADLFAKAKAGSFEDILTLTFTSTY